MVFRQPMRLALLLLALALAVRSGAQTAPAPGPKSLDVPENALVAQGKAPEVDVLFTGDVIGYIEPCG